MRFYHILIPVALLFLFTAKKKMMFLKKYVPFLQKWEGGLSNALTDRESKYPSPYTYKGKTGWHTNKGVTWRTFTSNAKKLGYEVNYANFINMPDNLWKEIFTKVYLYSYDIEALDNLPRIQACVVEFTWMSGGGNSEKIFANFQRKQFGVKDNNITKREIVDNFKKFVNSANEKKVFNDLLDYRWEWLLSIAGSANDKGWKRRLDEMRKLFG